MAVTKVLARDWKLEIQKEPSTWVAIKGLNTLSFSNSKNDTDTTDFNSEGATEHMVTSRSQEISAEGFYLVDKKEKTRDEGQGLVEALAEKIGPESLGQFRITNPAGTAKTFMASANIGDIGGGNDDATSWGVTLTVSGKMSEALAMAVAEAKSK